MRAAVIAVAVAIGWLTAFSVPALACIADAPSFEEAVRTSEAVAWVTVLDVADSRRRQETYRVDRILKGVLPGILLLDDPDTGLCGDPIGIVAGEGTTVIAAFGVPFYDQRINPIWFETPDGVASSVLNAEDVRTLADVEKRIRALVPQPATGPAEAPTVDLSGLLPVALLVAVGVLTVVFMRQPGGRRRG